MIDEDPPAPIGRAVQVFQVGARPGAMLAARMLNWSGQVLKVRRPELAAALSRPEAAFTGVYLLLGEVGGEAAAYIGEGDDISSRIKAHHAQKAWWTTAVLITAAEDKLDKAHIRYLESRLIRRAAEVGRVRLENAASPGRQGLGEANRAEMEVFLEDLVFVLDTLGVDAFTPVGAVAASAKGPEGLRNAGPLEYQPALAADDPRILHGETRLAVLRRLTEIGMAVAEDLPARSREGADARLDRAEAFAQVSRAVRLTVALEARLEEELALLLAGRWIRVGRTPPPDRQGPFSRDGAPPRLDRARDARAEATGADRPDGEQRRERLRETERYESCCGLSFDEAARRACEDLLTAIDPNEAPEDPAPAAAGPPGPGARTAPRPARPSAPPSLQRPFDRRETAPFRPPGMIRPP